MLSRPTAAGIGATLAVVALPPTAHGLRVALGILAYAVLCVVFQAVRPSDLEALRKAIKVRRNARRPRPVPSS
jgi:hypothetical protein